VVISHSHPYKDYTGIQERYAALGAPELRERRAPKP
jgi:hypothetical protein